ncbi:MAG TPA: trypsin-like peptidase domain-containing protein [Nocardia sp.]|uniref:S1C family serine protease n=1 Tax=Nocardia sp. TaxID=1821 RepID=UPI002B4AF30B|nr:trypsin-like peptidase domain-containing protein [Nocardia sp.]HLS79571.1 trypsin-like peptidase domain-containing protein [Nocardia sp.]
MHEDRRGGGTTAVLVIVALVVTGFLGFGDGWPWERSGPTVATVTRPPAPPLDQAAVAAALTPAMVHITTRTRALGQGAAGSGIVLTPDGQVLTSHHVIKGAEEVSVVSVATGEQYQATVLGYDSGADIALLSLIGARELPVARLGSSAGLRVRDEVLALGNAGGAGGIPTATPGRITALDSTIVALNAADFSRKALRGMVEIEAPVSSGQSGGALADWQATVVGVVTASAGQAEPDPTPAAPAVSASPRAGARPTPSPKPRAGGYAVPIDTAMKVVEQIRSGIPSDSVHIGQTATLGVLVSDARPSGARVDVALYGLPAHGAGIRDGDTIVSLDGRAIGSSRALRNAIDRRRPRETVRLGVLGADGVERIVSVELALGTPN